MYNVVIFLSIAIMSYSTLCKDPLQRAVPASKTDPHVTLVTSSGTTTITTLG